MSVFNQDVVTANRKYIFKKWVEIKMNVRKFAVLAPDKDETSVCVDKERVHQRGEHTWRAGGSGEFSHTSDEWSRWDFFL